MTKDEYKNAVTPDVVREVFEDNIFYPELRKWAMFVSGKLISIQGKCFYDSREQALKSLYNSLGWKVKREIWVKAHPGEEVRYWRQPDAGMMWRAFKEVITEKYGFNVVKIHD